MNKVTLEMRVSVHPIKAALWSKRAKIKSGMSLREIGAVVGEKSPQKLKHHLQAMVVMGSVDYIGGQYVFPKE
jgi:hypothetical protein